MNKFEIISALREKHLDFTDYIASLSDEDFMYFPMEEKWTAGQQAEHIHLSVSPVATAMKLPNFILGPAFGKANRPSRTYDEVVAKYQRKLAEGGVATSRFRPDTVTATQKAEIKNRVDSAVEKLCGRIEKFSEEQLDTFLLPHPLLGKMTLREMLYFTIYHVQHHHKMTILNLERN